MIEVTGKTLHYWQNSVEVPIKSIDYDRNFTMLEATTTATTAPGTKSVAGRAKTGVTINTDLLDVLGSEIATGTLTAGQEYIVTAEDSELSAYSVGEIFTAAGTEEMSATDKVKPLGAKITGKTLAITIAAGTFKGITAEYAKTYTELDGTTTATTAPNMKSVAGRHKITGSFTALMYRDTADLIVNASPAEQAVVITFATGLTITGNAILHQISISDAVDGIVQVTYNLEWQGVPTEVGIGYLTVGTEQDCEIIYEKGTTTNKEITGTVVLLSMTVSSDTNGEASLSYTGVLNGAITPAVYS